MPLALRAKTSLSEEKRPTVINAPTREAKGKAIDIIAGREKIIRRRTSKNGTSFDKTSSAIRRSWFTKNIKKKKRKATKKEKRNSFPIYFWIHQYQRFIKKYGLNGSAYCPVEPKPPSPLFEAARVSV